MFPKLKISKIIILLTTILINPVMADSIRHEEGNLVIEGIPAIPSEIENSLIPYQNVRSAGFSDWLNDNQRMLISTRFADSSQVHLVEKPGGARQQLTFFKEPVAQVTICPNKKYNGFLFSKDTGGNENFQIYYYDFNTGKYKMLTDGKSRNEINSWSNNGDRFIYRTTNRNGKNFDLVISNMKNPLQTETLLEKEGEWGAGAWSKDDQKIIVSRFVSANESYLYIMNLKNKQLMQINPTKEKISYGGVRWSPDEKGLYFTSDQGSEFKQLKYYNLASKKTTVLTKNINWNVEGFGLSYSGKQIVFSTNEDGLSKLHLVDAKTFKEIKLPEIPAGILTAYKFTKNDATLAFSVNTPQTPGDVYSLDMKTKKITRWTYSEVGGLKTSDFIKPEVIHYPTFDKINGKPRKIPAFYYKPKQKNKKFPVIIQIHGGPELQYRPYFTYMTQYYLNEMGIAYIAPNIRGSENFGKTYLAMDDGFKRQDTIKDIGALLDWIKTQPELDSEKVAVMGSSYGGFMTLACMAEFNNRLKAGIDSVGISNFVTFLKNTSGYRQDLRRVEYGDERDPAMAAFLQKISPTTNAGKIKKPMFIIQGLNNPRVPVTEAEQMIKAIRNNGSDVWYLQAKDEGHGFAKKSNNDYLNQASVLFFRKYLLEN